MTETLTTTRPKVHACDLGDPLYSGDVRSTMRRRALDLEEIHAFTHVGDEVLERVRLIRTNLLPRAADGMTIGRFVLLRGDRITQRGTTLLAHELVHVRQFAELGAVRFLSQYVGAYLRNLWKFRNHRRAYLEIPLEIEARREAAEWAEQPQ